MAVPPNFEFTGLRESVSDLFTMKLSDLTWYLMFQSREPAKTYKFTLDPFQSRSVLCLENDQSVLVSAHTSAGKTVVAEVVINVQYRLQFSKH